MIGKISKLCNRYHCSCSCFFKECIVLGVRYCVLVIALCIYSYGLSIVDWSMIHYHNRQVIGCRCIRLFPQLQWHSMLESRCTVVYPQMVQVTLQ